MCIFHQTYILQRTIQKAMHTVMIMFSTSHLTDGTAIYNSTTSKRLSFNNLYANTSTKSCRIRLFVVLRLFIKDKPQQEVQETMRCKDTEFAAVRHKHKHAHTHTWPESRESCKEVTHSKPASQIDFAKRLQHDKKTSMWSLLSHTQHTNGLYAACSVSSSSLLLSFFPNPNIARIFKIWRGNIIDFWFGEWQVSSLLISTYAYLCADSQRKHFNPTLFPKFCRE